MGLQRSCQTSQRFVSISTTSPPCSRGKVRQLPRTRSLTRLTGYPQDRGSDEGVPEPVGDLLRPTGHSRARCRFQFVPLPPTILVVFVGALSAMVTRAWLLLSEDGRAFHEPASVSSPTTHWSADQRPVPSSATRCSWAWRLSCWSSWPWPTSPYAVSAYGRWPRSVPTPSVQMDAMARALGDASPEYLTFQPSLGRRSADGGVVSKLAGQLHSAAAPALSRSDGPRP